MSQENCSISRESHLPCQRKKELTAGIMDRLDELYPEQMARAREQASSCAASLGLGLNSNSESGMGIDMDTLKRKVGLTVYQHFTNATMKTVQRARDLRAIGRDDEADRVTEQNDRALSSEGCCSVWKTDKGSVGIDVYTPEYDTTRVSKKGKGQYKQGGMGYGTDNVFTQAELTAASLQL